MDKTFLAVFPLPELPHTAFLSGQRAGTQRYKLKGTLLCFLAFKRNQQHQSIITSKKIQPIRVHQLR
jgi:hypothetical protein